MQLNAANPIMVLYGNREMCLKKDFCLIRPYLMQLVTSRGHGWGQEMEVLVFLHSLAPELSLSVVSSTFGIHSRARSVVEQAFGMMKTHWRATLSKAQEVHPHFAADIIACCAFLHNLCLIMNDVLEEMENPPPPDEKPQNAVPHWCR